MKLPAGPRTVVFLLVGILMLTALFAALPLFLDDPYDTVLHYDASPLLFDRNGGLMNVSLSAADEWCLPVSIDKMGAWAPLVAVAIEDKRFFEHFGVDILAIARAFLSNLKAGRIISGASTITSQLIRISDPRERTYSNKISEFARASLLERKMGKQEILELYLNRAPFGGNLRGIEAASLAYFGKSAGTLSLSDAVLLISILRAPSRLRPDRFPDRARQARDRNLENLAKRGIINSDDLSIALSEPLLASRKPFPRSASMASAHARAQAGNPQTVNSSIDPSFQKLLENRISLTLAHTNQGITAAGIILDNSSGEVLAYVGNGRHGDALPGAQVDCGASPRSPGSTLKPFIYAYVFEKGLLTPASLLADTPTAFKGNAPRNFDLSYRGPVSARYALASSLNAPAVRVLRIAGYSNSLQLLRSLGFEYLNEESSYYSDSLILGGCETTLLELAASYRTLANAGKYSRLSWIKGAVATEKQVLSPAASYLTIDILQDTRRLIPVYQEIMKNKEQVVGFKTGTSYGLRDAWSIGFTRSYTIAIWFGAPDGRGYDELVGLRMATPVMLGLFRDISKPDELAFDIPENIVQRKNCVISGMMPGRYCANIAIDFVIERISKQEICSLHKLVDGKIVLLWPDELGAWMKGKHTKPQANVKIIRPASGSLILNTEGTSSRIFLLAEGTPPFFWYLDGKFIGSDESGAGIFWDVSKGGHRVNVLSGNESNSVTFDVVDSKAKDACGRPAQILN